MITAKKSALVAALSLVISTSALAQETTLTFQGVPYVSAVTHVYFAGGTPGLDLVQRFAKSFDIPLSITLTLAEPLGKNWHNVGVTPVSFTVLPGVISINNQISNPCTTVDCESSNFSITNVHPPLLPSFAFSTNSKGEITDWTIQVTESNFLFDETEFAIDSTCKQTTAWVGLATPSTSFTTTAIAYGGVWTTPNWTLVDSNSNSASYQGIAVISKSRCDERE